MYEYELYKPQVLRGTGLRIYKDSQPFSDLGVFRNKQMAILKAGSLYLTYAGIRQRYTGKKSEYSDSKQGNFMKIHPLDRV